MLNPYPSTQQTRELTIIAPSRLHFGLLDIGLDPTRQFGGAGLMIEQPETRVALRAASHLQVEGAAANTVRSAVERWHRQMVGRSADLPDNPEELPIQVTMIASPMPHTGLGSGTQRSLAIASGLSRWFNLGTPLLIDDVLGMGRGLRSAVGSHGFFRGGFIVDRGRLRQSLGELAIHVDLPRDWRVVLICPRDNPGPSGDRESELFRRIPRVPDSILESLRNTLFEEMVPAAQSGDFTRFSEAVYQYGHDAGLIFQSVQSGPYRGEQVREIVEFLRQQGVAGVGQSSWGPTVFALVDSAPAAQALLSVIHGRYSHDRYSALVTEIAHRGHAIEDKTA